MGGIVFLFICKIAGLAVLLTSRHLYTLDRAVPALRAMRVRGYLAWRVAGWCSNPPNPGVLGPDCCAAAMGIVGSKVATA